MPRDDDRWDEDDRPRRAKSGGNGMAVAALVLGILSLFCSFLTGLPALIFGVLGLAKAGQTGSGKGMAITGMALAVVGTVVTGVGGYYAVLATKKGVERIKADIEQTSEDLRAQSDLREVVQAAHHHHDYFTHLPHSYLHARDDVEPPADPSIRLSWRVALLPFLEQDVLYRRFEQGQAWNSAANLPLSNTAIRQYSESSGSVQTRYRVFVGNGALFNVGQLPLTKQRPDRRSTCVRLPGDVTDGTSNTIFCVEATETVPWAQHKEFAFDPNVPLPPFGRPNSDTFAVAMLDGSTRIVKKSVDPKVIKAAITRAGNEQLPLDW
jgi:hypothetical protein